MTRHATQEGWTRTPRRARRRRMPRCANRELRYWRFGDRLTEVWRVSPCWRRVDRKGERYCEECRIIARMVADGAQVKRFAVSRGESVNA